MQTSLNPEFLKTKMGQRADEILRKCVHCGFCTATCPTYQLLGDELDGPRGRIYQIKQILEEGQADAENQIHFDRCLTCRSCETTCPSGVNYAELIDIGRHRVEALKLRPAWQVATRKLLGSILPFPRRNRLLFKTAGLSRPFLPSFLKQKTPIIRPPESYQSLPGKDLQKTVLLLEGCVQSTLSPNTNAAAVVVLQSLGYQVIREPDIGCCGAVNHHLGQTRQAGEWMLKNLKQWQSLDNKHSFEAIVSTASGCGLMLKDYPGLLAQFHEADNQYDSLLTKIKDISELFDAETLLGRQPEFMPTKQSIAFHSPCSLTHGHKLADHLYRQLSRLGYHLHSPRDAHLCCGSAGTYSLLQPSLSQRLRNNKLTALQDCGCDIIISANVGCEHHLSSTSLTPVIHWLERIAEDLQPGNPEK